MSDSGDQIPIDATIDADASAIQRLRAAAETATPDARSSAARDFVADARRAQEAPTEPVVEPTRRRGAGRSSLVILLAFVIGAQVVAGGVYLALQSLRTDDQELATADEEAVVPTVETDVAVENELAPTPVPTVELEATPTPVPPTPEWIPVDDGPRWAPFTFVVSALGLGDDEGQSSTGGFEVWSEPNGDVLAPRSGGAPLPVEWSSGAPVRLRVISGDPSREWVQVELPDDASSLAWVQSAELAWEASYRLIQIDAASNRLRVFEGNDVLFEAIVATGSLQDPTIPQRTWLVENPFGDGLDEEVSFRFATSGDDAPLRLEVTDDDGLLGSNSTDGTVLISTREAQTVARAVLAGAKVEVVGRPVPPTPTPLPTSTPLPEVSRPNSQGATSPGSSGGCPRGTQGTAPDCYRVVSREQLPGECAGLQQPIDGFCMSLSGNPDVIDGVERCPEQAPRRIGDLCYVVQGRIPTIDGPCPPSSVDVDGECRQAVVP